MNRICLLLACLVLSSVALAQCPESRYRDMIFTDFNKTIDIPYGSNVNYSGTTTELLLDVYEPSGDTEVDRPLIIFAHGGSFISGSKEGLDVVPMCEDLSRMGYVVASINYRLGLPFTLNLEQPATEAVVRGYHDMKAAIRFFRKDVAENGNTYNIDPDKIYIAGSSAGAFITLHIAYMDEEEEIPDVIDQSLDGLGGGLEGESGNDGYSSEVGGIVNICGALGDTAWMKIDDEPVCSFHGTGDATVPFGSEILYLFDTFPVLEVDGSSSVDLQAGNLGLTHCFEIYEMQGHVPHVTNPAYYDTTLSITSNFLSHLVCPEIDLDCDYREVEVMTGIEKIDLSELLTASPNPFSDNIQIRSRSGIIGRQYQIFNTLGQEVNHGRIESTYTNINTGPWPPGIYIIRVSGIPTSVRMIKS